MKKIIIISFLLFIAVSTKAQIKYSNIDTSAQYCLIVGTQKFMSKGVNIDIDFGQEQSLWKSTGRLVDDNGKKMEFNSMIDALNYMNKNGWEFVDAYAIAYGSGSVYHFLMKRSK